MGAGGAADALIEGGVTWAGLGFMVGSAILHIGYYGALQRGYAHGDLSVVYPLARGTGPLLSVTAAILFLGERPGTLGLVGGLLIVVAVLTLAVGATAGIGDASPPARSSPPTRCGTRMPSTRSTSRRPSTSGSPGCSWRCCSRRWPTAYARPGGRSAPPCSASAR